MSGGRAPLVRVHVGVLQTSTYRQVSLSGLVVRVTPGDCTLGPDVGVGSLNGFGSGDGRCFPLAEAETEGETDVAAARLARLGDLDHSHSHRFRLLPGVRCGHCGWARNRCSVSINQLDFAPPNQRLQLTLPPFGARPLAVLRGGFIMDGEIVVVAFVRRTPVLRRGAAETQDR